jgi:hypothetical protein
MPAAIGFKLTATLKLGDYGRIDCLSAQPAKESSELLDCDGAGFIFIQMIMKAPGTLVAYGEFDAFTRR